MTTGTFNPTGINFNPLAPGNGGTGVINANTLTIGADSAINQDVRTTGTPSFARASAANFINGYATTATAAGTTTLVVGSAQQQFFTGTTTQTVLLPVTSTLVLGQTFLIVNNSTGAVTVQSSGGNTIQAMAAGTQMVVTVILTSGTSAASWNAEYTANTTGVASVTGTANRITSTGGANPVIDIAATYVGQASITTVGALASGSLAAGFTTVTVPLGGTGAVSQTAYAVLCGGTTSTGAYQSIASVGTAGQVLTSAGAGALPSFQTPSNMITFVSVAGTSQLAAKNTAYGLQNAAQVTVTLPASAGLSVGDVVYAEGYGAAGFVIQLVGAQVANSYGGLATSAAGTITTRDPNDTTNSSAGNMIALRYTGTDTFWIIGADTVGNFALA
jgi:hypothetical protein